MTLSVLNFIHMVQNSQQYKIQHWFLPLVDRRMKYSICSQPITMQFITSFYYSERKETARITPSHPPPPHTHTLLIYSTHKQELNHATEPKYLVNERTMHPQHHTCPHEQSRIQHSRHYFTVSWCNPREDFIMHGYLSKIPLRKSVTCVL